MLLLLDKEAIQSKKDSFSRIGIKTPNYDYRGIWEETKKEPIWLHIGGGNLFRAFHSVLQQHLIEKQKTKKGIIVVSTMDDGLIEKIYHPYDNLSLNVVMKSNGTLDMEVIASVAESIAAYSNNYSWQRLIEIFTTSSLQFITLSITEKGYELRDIKGNLQPTIIKELEQGLYQPKHTMVMLTSLLNERYKAGKIPLALVSTDNFSHNGDKLKDAILTVAAYWQKRGVVDKGFIEYLTDQTKIAFPWTMIDKITPLPSVAVKEKLSDLGYGSTELIKIRENAPTIAPFVNTEESEYLVM